ncbi:MAG: hypothetical protein ACRD0D_07990, partial [Acidimicrobiales bacterium]
MVRLAVGDGRESAPPGGGAPVGRRRLAVPAICATLTVLTWPVPGLGATGRLDGSWVAALNLAAHRGLDFGTEVVFTYGPLGFLGFPRLYFGWTAALAFAYAVAVHASLCTTVFLLARRSWPAWVAAAMAFAGGALAGWTELAEAMLIVLVLWCLAAAGGRLGPALARRLLDAATVVAALHLL